MIGEEDKKKDIFQLAAEKALAAERASALDVIRINSDFEAVESKTQLELALEKTESNSSEEWNVLAAAMEGRFAKKFMEKLDALPDKEFVRIYPKMLEYFKPKVTRKEPLPPADGDNVIRIEILQIRDDGSKHIIDISHKEEDEDDD